MDGLGLFDSILDLYAPLLLLFVFGSLVERKQGSYSSFYELASVLCCAASLLSKNFTV